MIVLIAMGVLCPSSVFASRSTSAAFLKIGVGGRSAAMGEAYTAAADDVTSLYWNPAGLARLRRQQFIFMHVDWFQAINYEYMGYARPLGENRILGASLTYVDKGDLARTTYGNPFGTGLGTFKAEDYAGQLSYAWRYTPEIDLGASLKFVRQVIENESAMNVAADMGVQYRGLYPGLTLGASLLNLGNKAKFVSVKEELPLLLRVGAAYQVRQFPLLASVDAVMLKGDASSFRMGLEYSLNEYLDARVGYNSANDADNGWGLGFGVNIDNLSINYAFVPYGELGNTHRIDSVFSFGPTYGEEDEAPAPAPIPPAAPPVASGRVTGPDAGITPPQPAAPEPPAAQTEALMRQAAYQEAQGDYRGAAATYQQVLQLEPYHYQAYYNLGLAAYRLADYTAARDAFTYALQIEPNLSAMVNLGGAYYQLGDYANAARMWEQALEDAPDNHQAGNNLDVLYRNHPELRPGAAPPEESAAAPLAPAATRSLPAESPVEENPLPAPLEESAAAPLAPAGEAAVSADDPLVETQVKYLLQRGAIQEELNQLAAAANSYREVLRLSPDNYQAYRSLGRVAFTLGEYQEAAMAFGNAVALRTDDNGARINLGAAYNGLGDFGQAAAVWEEALQREPGNETVRNNLAVLYREHPEVRPGAAPPASTLPVPAVEAPAATAPPAAAASAPPAMVVRPGEGGSPLLYEAYRAHKDGALLRAAELYREYLDAFPDSLVAHYNLANILYALHEYDDAVLHYQNVLRQESDNEGAMVNLGAAYYKLKRFQLAAQLWQRAVRTYPENAVAAQNLARAQQRLAEQ